MNRRQFVYLCVLLLLLPALSVSISSQRNITYETEEMTIGYNITETYIGIIKDLEQDENHTSFTGIIGLITIFSERDGGGIAVGIGSLRKVHITWSNKYSYQGILTNHIIWGRVKYRIE